MLSLLLLMMLEFELERVLGADRGEVGGTGDVHYIHVYIH